MATLVCTVNVPLVAPCGMIKVDGTVATAVSLLERFTVSPPPGAGLKSVTVPVEVCPPVTVEGLSAREDKTCGANTISDATFVSPA